MIISNTTQPNITLQDVKEHLVIDYDTDDTLLQSYLDSAIVYAYTYIGIYPYGRTYISTPEEMDSEIIYSLDLPERPHQVQIEYPNSSTELSWYEITNYYDKSKHILFIPKTDDENGDYPTQITAEVKLQDPQIGLFNQAVKLIVGDFYKFRENAQTLTVKEIPQASKMLLDIIMMEV
jgi:hypothetical protein